MKVLILGAAGMLGHKLWQTYRERFDTWITARSTYAAYQRYGLFDQARLVTGVDAQDFATVVRTFDQIQPDVVINCIGIIKQLPTASNPLISISINSLFPHQLADLCQTSGTRLIHISTDCVFSGRKGMYVENDITDAEDLYGRTKALGEVNAPNCLTIRTSIIGRELNTTSGLVEWFLSQNHRGTIRGYTQAIYSGFPTCILAEIIGELIEHHVDLEGIYNVSSNPISKFELLHLLERAYGVNVDIEPYPQVQIDRSLDSTRFRQSCNYTPPSWVEMIAQMIADPSPYDTWRHT